MNVPINVRCETLPSARTPEEYQVHCDALEWSLADPIIIHDESEIKSRTRWERNVEPFRHQVENLIRFCRRLPVTLLADDVGLGKTISAGLILSELMTRKRVDKTLVVCPKILMPQWEEELYTKFGITGKCVTGRQINHASRSADVVITTYHSASSHICRIRPDEFQMLILDEAHKVRNLHGTREPPKMAQQIHLALRNRLFKYAVLLTATPIQNRLWDIYSLIDCLTSAKGHKNPFGTPDEFARDFIADGKNKARVLATHKTRKFREIVGQYMFRTRRMDVQLAFPDRNVKTYAIPPDPLETRLWNVVGSQIGQFKSLVQSSILVALMSSPNALKAQLEKMAAANPEYRSLASAVAAIADRIRRPAKLKAVFQLIEQLKAKRPHDWRMVIFTTRLETQKKIQAELEQGGIRCGLISGGNPEQNNKTIRAFRANHPQINVVISTDAGSEGVNLQVANVLVNYDLPWNPMVVEQRIGRIQRLASQHKNIFVVNVVHRDSPEEHIVGRLSEKLQLIAHSVGDIEAVLGNDKSDVGDSFEKQIRELVVKSLEGQDTVAATRMAEQSIEQAKEIFEKQRDDIDQKLGDLSGRDHKETEIPMPKLTQAKPTRDFQSFVRNALLAKNGQIEEVENGVFRYSAEGFMPEYYTFDENRWQEHAKQGRFMGNSPRLYIPGRPDFERLVQKWVDHSACKLYRADPKNHFDISEIVNSWATSINAQLNSFKVNSRSTEFSGSVVCRTKAVNALDSYEKLVSVPVTESGWFHEADLPECDLVEEPFNPSEANACLEARIKDAVGQDPDIHKFCNYYLDRLGKEIEKCDTPEKQKRIEYEFSPTVFAEVNAVEGSILDIEIVQAKISFNGQGDYDVELKVCTAINRVIEAPQQGVCALTKQSVPAVCLSTCEVTGQQVMKHLLIKLDNGSFVLPEFHAYCEQSHANVLKTDTDICDITGKRVLKRLLYPSELSNRKAIIDETVNCAFTGRRLLSDEVVTSDLSGKPLCLNDMVKTDDGRIAHPSETAECEFSHKIYPLVEMAKSELSGKTFCREYLVRSEKTDRLIGATETKKCNQTGRILAVDEVAKAESDSQYYDRDLLTQSDVSGKWDFDQYTLRSEKSGRVGLRSEISKCEETGKLLLEDEVATCALSGLIVDRALLAHEANNQTYVLKSRLVICEKSGELILPADQVKCAVSGMLVNQKLTVKSGTSGKTALKELCIQCGTDNRFYLPQEVDRCSVSKKYFPKEQIKKCYLTGQNVHTDFLLCSEVSGRWGLAGKMRTCPIDGSVCGPDELAICFWSGRSVSRKNVAQCVTTGMTFGTDLLDTKGQFRLIETGFNNKANAPELPNGKSWLKSVYPTVFSGVRSVKILSGPSRNRHLIFGEIKFPFAAKKLFACILEGQGNQLEFKGTVGLFVVKGNRRELYKRITVGDYN